MPLLSTVTLTGIAFGIALLAGRIDRRIALSGAVLFAFALAVDDMATTLPRWLPTALQLPGHWNWGGKVASLVSTVLLALLLRRTPGALGLAFPPHRPRVTWAAVAVLTAVSASLGFVFRPAPPSIETIAFQLTMPALAEELVFRGLAPALLLGMRTRTDEPTSTPWSVVLVTAIAFGAWHMIGVRAGHLTIDVGEGVIPLIGGVAYGWLRFASGTVILPMIAHALGNTAFLLGSLRHGS